MNELQMLYPPDYSMEFLSFPILFEADWPEIVYERANDCGVDPEVIAESMGIKTKQHHACGMIWMKRELVESIDVIIQHKINHSWSYLQMADGELYLVNLPADRLMEYIEYFLVAPYILEEKQQQQKLEPEKKKRGRPKKIVKNEK